MIFFVRKLGKAFSIVEREAAPLSSNSTMFQGRENMSLIGKIVYISSFPMEKYFPTKSGPLAIATPGELLAYKKAYDQFGGGASWASLFKATIRLCAKGFNVSAALAFAIEKNKEHILNDTELRYVKFSLSRERFSTFFL